VDGAQDRGESILEQRAARGMGACQCFCLRWKEKRARLTGKDTNRAPGCLVVPALGPDHNCARVSGGDPP
jgi:hypothetical protein